MSYKKNFSMRQLLDAGVHFGHRTNYWNPKMAQYIYGSRNGTHIIDLQQTAPMLDNALKALYEVTAKGGRVLFVGTKKQAAESILEGAQKCGQYYVNHRWLGGMLTNWGTVSASIKTLSGYEKILDDENNDLNKKERLELSRKKEKLDNVLGGIRKMGGMPDMLFVIDTRTESLAIKEAKKLGIPVVAVVDTNSSYDEIDHVIPGNDDARKAIHLYCDLVAEAVLNGMQDSMANAGVDVGAKDMEEIVDNDNEEKEVKKAVKKEVKKAAPAKTKKAVSAKNAKEK